MYTSLFICVNPHVYTLKWTHELHRQWRILRLCKYSHTNNISVRVTHIPFELSVIKYLCTWLLSNTKGVSFSLSALSIIQLTFNKYIKTYKPMECGLFQCSLWKYRPIMMPFLKSEAPNSWCLEPWISEFLEMVQIFFPFFLLPDWYQSYFYLQC